MLVPRQTSSNSAPAPRAAGKVPMYEVPMECPSPSRRRAGSARPPTEAAHFLVSAGILTLARRASEETPQPHRPAAVFMILGAAGGVATRQRLAALGSNPSKLWRARLPPGRAHLDSG